jgi:hypothetical protein
MQIWLEKERDKKDGNRQRNRKQRSETQPRNKQPAARGPRFATSGHGKAYRNTYAIHCKAQVAPRIDTGKEMDWQRNGAQTKAGLLPS